MKNVIVLNERDLTEIVAEKYGVSVDCIKLKIEKSTEGYWGTKVIHIVAEIVNE